MTKELVISSSRHETKVALLEDDQLVEIFFQRSNEYSLAGSIHKGRVTRVLPGMQSAFVDLGLERDTFLYVSDFFEESEEYEKLPSGEEKPAIGGRRGRRDGDRERERSSEARALSAGAEQSLPPAAEPAALPAKEEAALAVPRAERPSGQRSTPDDDRQDRRGRRGRRRRGRGRGLPESKYAQAREEEAPPAPETEPVELSDFAVLPGETLAKYSRPGSEDNGEDEVPEIDAEADAEPPSVLARAVAEPDAPSGDARAAAAAPMTDIAPGDDQTPAKAAPAAETEAQEEPAKPVETEAVPEPDAGAKVEDEEEEEQEEEEGEEEEEEAPVARGSEADDESEDEEQEGLTEEQLDQIQQQAEAFAEDGSDADEGNNSDAEPEGEAEGDAEAVGASSDENDSDSEEADSSENPDEDRDIQEMVLDRISGEDSEEEDPEKEPALASIESMASSHREQTARFLRGRRTRRRRNQSPDDKVRTVPRDTKADRGDEQPEKAERAERPERAERGRSGERSRGGERVRPEKAVAQTQSISDLLKEGQEIVVQVAKEPMGQKGARITSHVALPGRYCVYMPTVEHLGVSRKIASDEERMRLRRILQTHREGIPGGFIIRTAGEGKSEEAIAQDIRYLYQLWLEIRAKAEKQRAPALLYHDVEIVQRLLRDQLTESFKSIWVDNPELYDSVVRFVQRLQPTLVSRVKLYTRSTPIFDAFNITPELEKAMRPKVWLKSGGYIVINQTEALVAIDVNTGKYVGKSHRLEDTIVKTNIDAVNEIVRQIRLRDLGGIIVVDFIDMDERKNRQKVMQALEEAMRADRAPNKILQFNDFGLVAITRKRVKQSLERSLCSPCPMCEGSGYTKSVQTIIGELMAEAQKVSEHLESKEVVLRVHPSVAVTLKSKDNDYLEEIEEIFQRPVVVTGDPTLHPEKFDVC